MASLNAVHLEKKREAYLATAKPISSLLVDDTGDENYGDVPDGQFPEDSGYNNADSRPVMSDELSGEFGDGLRPMRPTDIREAQLKQMSAAEKDFYFVQGDVNVTSNDTSYNTEYEDGYGEDYEDDYSDDDYSDEYYDEDIIDDSDAYSDADDNEFEMELDFTDLDDDLDDDGFIVVDDDGDIDEDDGYNDYGDYDCDMDYDDYDNEEEEDLEEIVALLQSMGISSFGDDFDDGYSDLDDELITVASIRGSRKHHKSHYKDVTGTIPVNLPSRPTDPDSTAASIHNGVSRKPKHSGETRGGAQTSGKSNKVYGLLFK